MLSAKSGKPTSSIPMPLGAHWTPCTVKTKEFEVCETPKVLWQSCLIVLYNTDEAVERGRCSVRLPLVQSPPCVETVCKVNEEALLSMCSLSVAFFWKKFGQNIFGSFISRPHCFAQRVR